MSIPAIPTPSIGRIVLYRGSDGRDRPAIITHVWSDFCVNLYAFPKDGSDVNSGFRTSVTHIGPETGETPSNVPSWRWMPYQIQTAGQRYDDKPKADETGPNIVSIARVCHEVNRAYCEAMGDTSQLPWVDAPEWQKESACKGVALHKFNDVGPQASHESWMAVKVADGWVYGPVKDPVAKTHPCMVPFDQLPREQQAKDFIFRAVVHALR